MLEHLQLHQGQPVLTAGETLSKATAAMILVHGRGASAESILTLAADLQDDRFAYLAPQAANSTWYPNSFLAPLENNEPWLSSALGVLDNVFESTLNAGVPANHTLILGFSQGACLATEFVARHPQKYGGLVTLSGGLIGPSGTEFNYSGFLDNTPVFIGCSDIDPHIPLERVRETAKTLKKLGAEVTENIYPGMGHMVNQDELAHVRKMMDRIFQ